ncbi:MAG TPA: helix-turn-helix transcriptional regulator [Rickettsia endosymbiont of Degeeriella rufa]|nr:helix-turn-helix transcriptional regulator [Rickettsia endosymbiont of Degeeriella rufa]
MDISLRLQKFLIHRIKISQIQQKDLMLGTSLSRSTISKLLSAVLLNPNIMTVVKIATFFECDIDEVLGRKKFIHRNKKNPYLSLTLSDIKCNLTSFLKIKLCQYNITEYVLEKNCRLGSSTITHFINLNNNRMLSTKVVVKLADYFQISIDEMIGRINI